jgi:Ca2+-binding EF-hand superfamily protein
MKVMEKNSKYEQYDIDGDGIVSDEELARVEELLRVEHERAQYENEDKKQDAQRVWLGLLFSECYSTPLQLYLQIS